MSGFQIIVLIWLTVVTSWLVVNLFVDRFLWKKVMGVDKTQRHDYGPNLDEPKNNPFLKAGLDAIRKRKKKGSQSG